MRVVKLRKARRVPFGFAGYSRASWCSWDFISLWGSVELRRVP